MFHTVSNLDTAACAAAVDPTALHGFVREHLDGLTNAADLLAGRQGVRLVAELADGLARGPAIGRATLRAARDLLDILSLENVHDPECEQAARFALIDPADPRVEEICLLTDDFCRALDQAVSDHPPALHLRSVA